MKPGYKSTEFWMTVAVNVAALLAGGAGLLPPKYALVAMTASNGLYSIVRSAVKIWGVPLPAAVPPISTTTQPTATIP